MEYFLSSYLNFTINFLSYHSCVIISWSGGIFDFEKNVLAISRSEFSYSMSYSSTLSLSFVIYEIPAT